MSVKENILVCVTQQKTCERLIKKGAHLREKLGGDLYVIHVAKEGVNFLGNQKEAEALEYLFDISKNVGAELTVLRANNIISTIEKFAVEKSIGHIILGETTDDFNDDGIIKEIRDSLPSCEFYIMSRNEGNS